jgi:hypothetical protein
MLETATPPPQPALRTEINLPKAELAQLVSEADQDGTDRVDLEDFLDIATTLMEEHSVSEAQVGSQRDRQARILPTLLRRISPTYHFKATHTRVNLCAGPRRILTWRSAPPATGGEC